MTDMERIDLVKVFEKPGHKSKKFVAFTFMELLLAGLAFYALNKQPELGWPLAMFMFGIVVTMGAIALVFNGYQAKLDMYVRGMALIGEKTIGCTKKPFNISVKPPMVASDVEEVGGGEDGEA